MNSKPISSIGTTTFGFPTATPMCGLSQLQHRHGKAPPIGEFTTEDSRTTFDDWIPILECAANWNGWTADDSLMQPGWASQRQGITRMEIIVSKGEKYLPDSC